MSSDSFHLWLLLLHSIINQRGSGGALDVLTPSSKLPCVVPSACCRLCVLKLTQTGLVLRGYVLHVPGRRYLPQRPDFCRNLDSSHEEAAAVEAAILTPEHISLVMCSCSERFVFPEHLFSFPEYQISRLHF